MNEKGKTYRFTVKLRKKPLQGGRFSLILDYYNGNVEYLSNEQRFRSSVVVPEYALYFFKSECFISKCVGTFNGVVGQQLPLFELIHR